MYDIEKRRNQAASSILENERLTADLDDDAADSLLQWGLALTEKVVQDSQNLDDVAAEEAMYAPMKAVRKLMQAVNKWLNSGDATYLDVVLNQAQIIYGETAVLPPVASLTTIQTVPVLRQAIETPSPPSSGKDHDKKENNLE
ncbi:MAG: hypothetical protein IAF02_16705 [Anaerolineae bacterium]|nr:hypothetical protein [Anaerolineae bacterium]